MWYMKCTIIAVTNGVTIIVTGLKKNLKAIPGKHSIYSLQKNNSTWNITHTTLKVLQSETYSLSSGDHRWFERRSAFEKRPVARDNEIIIIINISRATPMHGPWRGDHKIHHSLKPRLNP
jgi:hypothetical protein